MWLIVFYDLPIQTKNDIKMYAKFRKDLLKDGFDMFQFSIYIRYCNNRDVLNKHINRVKQKLPPKGKVGILSITDQQFGLMQIFESKIQKKAPKMPDQLEMFEIIPPEEEV